MQVVAFGIFFLSVPILALQSIGLILLMKFLLLVLFLVLLLNLCVQIFLFLVLLVGDTKRILGLGGPDDPMSDPKVREIMNSWSLSVGQNR